MTKYISCSFMMQSQGMTSKVVVKVPKRQNFQQNVLLELGVLFQLGLGDFNYKSLISIKIRRIRGLYIPLQCTLFINSKLKFSSFSF